MDCKPPTMSTPESQLASTTPNPPKACFLTLPPEIRNMIYKYLLVDKKPLRFWCRQLEPYRRGATRLEKVLAIAHTCKYTRDESLPIFFGMNEFKFSSTDHMGVILRNLSKESRQLLRKVELTYVGRAKNMAFALLGECLELQTLRIELSPRTIHLKTGQRNDLFAAAGLKQLRKIKGCKNVALKRPVYKPGQVSDENVDKFENMLKEELCKKRVEVKKRAPKGQGKKALAAAAKMKGGNGTGSRGGNVA